jgi:hypothetical protein
MRSRPIPEAHTAARRAACLCLALVLLLAIPAALAAGTTELQSDADRLADKAGETTRSAQQALRTAPKAVGWFILVLALVPLLVGWRIVRVLWVVFFALALATVVAALALPFGHRHLGETAGTIATVVVALGFGVLGGWLGLVLQKVNAALGTAIFCGFILALPGILLEHVWLAVGLGAAGFVAGIVLGWIATYYLDAISMACLGAGLATSGVEVLVRDFEKDAQLIAAVATLVVSIAIGVVCQFRAIAREKRSGRLQESAIRKR